MLAHNCFRYILFGILACFACELSQPGWAMTTARDIRIGIHKDKTRVVLDLSGEVRYQISALADPYRIVIDLPDIKWDVPAATVRRKGGIIAGLRYGQYQSGNARVVLDLISPGLAKESFTIPPSANHGHRIVIDIRPTTRLAFIRTLQASPIRARDQAQPVMATKPKRDPAQKPLVVIDPGHGGVDPGAIGVSGIFEKRVTLAMAYQIRKAILALGRQRVKFTRYRDTFISLRRRVAVARAIGADLFLSVHADSITDRSIRGGGVYTLSEKASDKESAALAAKENRADLIAGLNLKVHDDEVASILIELTQRETMNYAAQFAASLLPELRQLIHMRRKPHRFAGFVVLKAPDVPSVLIELGYLSNRRDEKMLNNPKSQAAMAAGIARAVNNYFTAQKQ